MMAFALTVCAVIVQFLGLPHDFRATDFAGQRDILDYTSANPYPVVVAATSWDSTDPAAATDGANLMVVWVEHKPSGVELLAALSTDGTTWTWAPIPYTAGGTQPRVHVLWLGTFAVDYAFEGSPYTWRTYWQQGHGWTLPYAYQPYRTYLPALYQWRIR